MSSDTEVEGGPGSPVHFLTHRRTYCGKRKQDVHPCKTTADKSKVTCEGCLEIMAHILESSVRVDAGAIKVEGVQHVAVNGPLVPVDGDGRPLPTADAKREAWAMRQAVSFLDGLAELRGVEKSDAPAETATEPAKEESWRDRPSLL